MAVLSCALVLAMTLAGLFPASAFAAPDAYVSRTKGSILIRYSKDYASYDVYRIFDLAATTNGTPVQEDDTYEYVIKETLSTGSATGDAGATANPWWTFLTSYGPDGENSATPYAVLSSETSRAKKANALFIIDAESFALGGESGYHVVRAQDRYGSIDDIVKRGTTLARESAGAGSDEDKASGAGVAASSGELSGVDAMTGESAGTSADGHTDEATDEASADVPAPTDAASDADVAAGETSAAIATTTHDAVGSNAATFTRDALTFAKSQSFTNRSGHYVARGRETYGNAAEQANTDSVYQYSGDTAYVTNIPLGVYLLDVEEGTLCSMDMASSSTLVYDRKEYPELFVQVRAKGAAAGPVAYDELDGNERHDLVWSEDNLMRWAYRTDVNLGEFVQFKTVIIAQQGVTDYRLHDVMEYGLTFIDGADDTSYSPRVYFYSQADDTTYEVLSTTGEHVNWVLHTRNDAEDAPLDFCDFEIELKDVVQTATDEGEEKLTFAVEEVATDGSTSVATKDVSDWDRIVVTYWAQVNDNAVVFGTDRSVKAVQRAKDLTKVRSGASGTGDKLLVQAHAKTDGNGRNTNNAVLTYGDSDHTTWARAEVASYQFDIVRAATATASADTYPLLAGAQLALYKSVDADVAGAVAYTTDVNRQKKTYYYLPDQPVRFVLDGSIYTFATDKDLRENAGALTATLVSSNEFMLRVRGIEAGVYLLVENDAPAGSVKLERPILVTVHNRAYNNNDPVEDSTPGLKHSNAEGDITVTVYGEGGYSTTEVYCWQATVSGSPAAYKKGTLASTASNEVGNASKTAGTAATNNGGVLIAAPGDGSASALGSTEQSNGTSPLAACVAVVAVLATTVALVWMRMRRGVS